MLIQTKPLPHTCLVTAFAAIMDMTANELMAKIGHDGTLKTPLESVFRGQTITVGHNVQEVIMAMLDKYWIVEIMDPAIVLPGEDDSQVFLSAPNLLNAQDRIAALLPTHIGVVVGNQEVNGSYFDHAYAWDGNFFLNPDTGGVLVSMPTQPEIFYIVEKRQ